MEAVREISADAAVVRQIRNPSSALRAYAAKRENLMGIDQRGVDGVLELAESG
jgi:hypothetical protein